MTIDFNLQGFEEVSKDVFYAGINKTDSCVRSYEYYCEWTVRNTNAIVGLTTPGYLCRNKKTGSRVTDSTYYLKATLIS